MKQFVLFSILFVLVIPAFADSAENAESIDCFENNPEKQTENVLKETAKSEDFGQTETKDDQTERKTEMNMTRKPETLNQLIEFSAETYAECTKRLSAKGLTPEESVNVSPTTMNETGVLIAAIHRAVSRIEGVEIAPPELNTMNDMIETVWNLSRRLDVQKQSSTEQAKRPDTIDETTELARTLYKTCREEMDKRNLPAKEDVNEKPNRVGELFVLVNEVHRMVLLLGGRPPEGLVVPPDTIGQLNDLLVYDASELNRIEIGSVSRGD